MSTPKKPDSGTLVIRLKPGDDLRKSLQQLADQEKLDAAWVVTCAGSLTQYHLRFANRPEGTRATGHFEITALSGTLSRNGSHLHASVSDSNGVTVGGHLLDGSLVYTTAEIVIGYRRDLVFTREIDGSTPWPELQIRPAD